MDGVNTHIYKECEYSVCMDIFILPLSPISSSLSSFFLFFQNPFYPHLSRPSLPLSLPPLHLHCYTSLVLPASSPIQLESLSQRNEQPQSPIPNPCALSAPPTYPSILAFILASHPPNHNDDLHHKLESVTALGEGRAQSQHPVEFRILHSSLFQTEPRSGPQVTFNAITPSTPRLP